MDPNRAQVLGLAIMIEHKLYPEWTLKFDTAKRRLGQCSHHNKTISISIPFLLKNTEEEFIDTMRHEVAHALAGPNHGHDKHWKSICEKIGARPERCADMEKVIAPDKPVYAICPTCNVRGWFRYRMPSDIWQHAKCGTRLVWYRDGKIEIPRRAQAIVQRNRTGVRALDEILNSDDRIQEVSGDYKYGFEVILKDGYCIDGDSHSFHAYGIPEVKSQMEWVETCPNDHYDEKGEHN